MVHIENWKMKRKLSELTEEEQEHYYNLKHQIGISEANEFLHSPRIEDFIGTIFALTIAQTCLDIGRKQIKEIFNKKSRRSNV